MIELHDPERSNTLGRGLGEDMGLAVRYLQERQISRGLTLQGAGRTFCAGGNPYDSPRSMSLGAAAGGVFDTIQGFVATRSLAVPMACAVHGAMVGGAAAIFMHADSRIAETDATFQHGNLSRGVCPIAGYSHTLQLAIGTPRACEFYITDQV